MRPFVVLVALLGWCHQLSAQEPQTILEGGLARGVYLAADEVWFSTDQGAVRVREQQVELASGAIRVNTVASVNGEVWLGTALGIQVIGKGGTNQRIFESAVGSLSVVAITPTNHQIWIGTNRGLFVLKDEDVSSTSIREPVLQIANIDGEILVCSQRNLYRWTETGFEALLPDPRSVISVTPAGNRLWALTIGGSDLPGPVFEIDDWKSSLFVPESSGKYIDLQVQSIAEHKGEVLFGTTGGVLRLVGNRLEPLPTPGPRVPVNVMIPTEVGLLLGTTRGLFWQQDPSRDFQKIDIREFTSVASGVRVLDIEFNQGTAWLATSDGAYRVDFPKTVGKVSDLSNSKFHLAGLVLLLLTLALSVRLWLRRRA